jgi:hypothetical protein
MPPRDTFPSVLSPRFHKEILYIIIHRIDWIFRAPPTTILSILYSMEPQCGRRVGPKTDELEPVIVRLVHNGRARLGVGEVPEQAARTAALVDGAVLFRATRLSIVVRGESAGLG